MSGILPPACVESEEALLSCIIWEPGQLDRVRGIVQPKDFYLDATRRICEAILELDKAGAPAEIGAIALELKRADKLHQVGGMPYLAHLQDAMPYEADSIEHHAGIIAEMSRRRRVIAACQTHEHAMRDLSVPIEDACSKAEHDVLAAADTGVEADRPQSLKELAPEVLGQLFARRDRDPRKRRDGVSRVGLYYLDKMLDGGFERGNLYVVAGRPGMGKSAFAMQCCLRSAMDGNAAFFFSAEMPKDQLVTRMIAHLSGVPYSTLRKGDVQDWKPITRAVDALGKLPLSLDFMPGADMFQVRSRARAELARHKRESGAEPGLVAIDYAQILTGERQKGDSREAEVASISRRAQQMGGQLKCPIMLLSQLNRDLEKRPNKRPTLADLRESGALEQDAFAIIFLYRDDQYNKNSDDPGMCELIVGKNRNGSQGMAKVQYVGEIMQFRDLATEYDDLSDGIFDNDESRVDVYG